MKQWLDEHGVTATIAGGALVVGFLAAGLLTRPTPPPIEIRAREPQPSPTITLFVHVEGGVAAPGVYRLAGDARIFEAIEAAGGATPDAEVSVLNLAARVTDGQKLVVPVKGGGEAAVATPPGPGSPGAGSASSSTVAPASAAGAKININTATQRILESLPGIGPVTAQRIIAFRTSNGPFIRIEQLRNAGVNAATYERIKDLVAVE